MQAIVSAEFNGTRVQGGEWVLVVAVGKDVADSVEGDDEAAAIQAMRALLSEWGATVVDAPTGNGILNRLGEIEAGSVSVRTLERFSRAWLEDSPGQLRGALHVGVVPILNVALMPDLLGLFAAKHPGIGLTVEEISSTEIETALEEGRFTFGSDIDDR